MKCQKYLAFQSISGLLCNSLQQMHPLVRHHDVTPLSRLENLAHLLEVLAHGGPSLGGDPSQVATGQCPLEKSLRASFRSAFCALSQSEYFLASSMNFFEDRLIISVTSFGVFFHSLLSCNGSYQEPRLMRRSSACLHLLLHDVI